MLVMLKCLSYPLLQSLNLLSVLAAIRLDEKPDQIEKLLFSSLMHETVSLPLAQDKQMDASLDPLASSTWEEVVDSVD